MIQDKIRQIKLSRLEPQERWFLKTIDGLKVVNYNKYPSSIFFKNDDKEILFQINFCGDYIWVENDLIFNKLLYMFGYKVGDVQFFLYEMFDKYIIECPTNKRRNLFATTFSYVEDNIDDETIIVEEELRNKLKWENRW